jgi:two-component system sensor histidine kinase TctE
MPNEEEPAQPWRVQFHNASIRNSEIRIAYVYVIAQRKPPGRERSEPRLALIQVAETLDKRTQLANQIIKGVILPEFIILPVALALVWLALSRGLSPLSELQRQLHERKPDDLSPIEPGQVPEEISPLVKSLNELLERLSQTIQMQKRFIADAAHQMKTPLAGMRTQAELALRQTGSDDIHLSLEQLAKSSESATRLVNQLLALARAENQTSETSPFVPLDLSELARGTVQDWVPASLRRGIDMGFEHPGHPVMVSGNPTMLREALSNLIDNALRYTPASGSVTIRVLADEARQVAMLEVEDTGPGIAPAERGHVFERFYRILGSNTEGSGLGLSIVREIAQQHQAEVDIFDNPRSSDPHLPGALLRITLRMEQRAPFFEDLG